MKNLMLLILGLVSFSTFSQDLPFEKDEILIQFKKSSTPEILNQYQHVFIKDYEQISKTMNIWRVYITSETMNEIELTRMFNAHPEVIVSQLNHLVQLRSNVPNDPLFNNQWQYVQANNNDIDADLAWEVTTGGLTTDGDEIVVAIIDDGINIGHPDIFENLYFNSGEIPGDGIDNDGNGYIDDLYGWNVYTNGPNLNGGDHGTPVSGIIGAVGNNGIGVSGVNWDVKLMTIQGMSSNEATVIQAYEYALNARILYNQTNGEKGAFVVATNSSFGVDFGNPINFPLWCGFYDTMGEHGILSCGATINNNVDVDLMGDVPTACSSEYLISVTNTNINDTKVMFAGYGANTIDLGAPGEGAYTTTIDNYGPFGGTSGATPHVTGTIALLYATPCTDLITIAKENPSLAAQKVRDYILNGVDPNPSLAGITTTGGRLNVNNAVQALMNECENLGVEETKPSIPVKIYPNPSENLLNYHYPSTMALAKITFYTVDGRKVLESMNNPTDISYLSPGLYVVQLMFDDGLIVNEKIIKK